MTLGGAPTEEAFGAGSLMAGMGIIIPIALWVLIIVAMCKVYMKAGRGWWEAIIPVYSAFIFLKIINKSYWNILLFCIPIVNCIFAIIFMSRLSKKFGYGNGFTIGLFFLPMIFFPILAWGSSVYIEEGEQQEVAPAPVETPEEAIEMPAAPVETSMDPPVAEQTEPEPPVPPSM